MMRAILLWALICCGWHMGQTTRSSTGCYFYQDEYDFIADCSYLDLTYVPKDVPTNTTKLLMNGNRIDILRNDSFINVPHLRYLDISHSRVYDTEQMTFSPLHHIHTIDLSYNTDMTFQNFAKATYGLRNSQSLHVLKLDAINPLLRTFISLKVDNLIYLKGTSLKELHISNNGLIDYETGVVNNFPKTLEVFVARWNKFYLGSYLWEMLNATSLRYLDFSHLNDPAYGMRIPRSVNESIIHYPFPKNLEVLIFSHSCLRAIFIGDHVLPNKLKKIDLSNNYISKVMGPVYGLEKVHIWDLSNNIISYCNSVFFSATQNNSVNVLNFSNNHLGYCIDSATCDNVVRNLSNLKHLNLSRNRINILPPLFVFGNEMLELLDLSNNNLRTLDLLMGHISNLQKLDLSSNQLQTLSQKNIMEFNMMSNLSIYLKDNPLACVCKNIYFLEWMKSNQDVIGDFQFLTCHLPKGTITNLTNINVIIQELENECRSNVLTISLSLSGVVLTLSFIMFGIGYRYRWKIKYLYYIGRKKYVNMAIQEDEMEYLYDAFVSYADENRSLVREAMIPELEEKAGLKLCIHHRDFLPGEVIASNIVNAIQNSRKTLIVLSPSFLKSSWCEFEYNMARMEGVTRRQNIVLVVLYEPVKMKDLPKDMAALLSTNCYLEYNTDEYGSVIFWQKLVEAISSINLLD